MSVMVTAARAAMATGTDVILMMAVDDPDDKKQLHRLL